MTFLPIVDRELRSASRRKSTYRMRLWTAVIASFVTFGFLIVAFFGGNTSGAGALLLRVLSGYTAFLFVFSSLFLTADSISEEKREGTIGLLFLTELRGYDLVLGKFIARSINALYALLALLPVIAISLLFGGLTGVEFWRTALALINALFVSLVVGTSVSAVSRDSRTATSGAFASLLFLFGVLPALESIFKLPSFLFEICNLSPALPFFYAYEAKYLANPNDYWAPLISSHLLGWILLILASWLVTRTWQYKDVSSPKLAVAASLGRRRVTRRIKGREQLLDINPVTWLIGKERAAQALVWIIVLVWSTLITLVTFNTASPQPWLYWGARISAFLLKLLVASQACRFFAEARGNGMLELLLCTPLNSLDILRGQWLALRRMFFWPLLIFVLFHFVPAVLTVYRSLGTSGVTSVLAEIFSMGAGIGLLAALSIYFLADIYAICWFGAWLGLTAKKPGLAPLWTILFVVIIPSPLCFLDIIADLFFILWAVIKLNQDFRWVLAQRYESPRLSKPHAATPPVIGMVNP